MQPDEIMVTITIVLVVMYGSSQALTWWRNRTQQPVSQPRRAVRTSRPRAYHRRTAHERQQESTWIKAGLEAGIEAGFMARALKGNPAYNRRRVRAVVAMIETSPPIQPNDDPPQLLEPHNASV